MRLPTHSFIRRTLRARPRTRDHRESTPPLKRIPVPLMTPFIPLGKAPYVVYLRYDPA